MERAHPFHVPLPGPHHECHIRFHDLDLVLDLSGAAFVRGHGTLLVADLHFEKASSLARRGCYLPPYDTAATLARLAGAVARFAPGRIICLGDSFHDPEAPERLDAGLRDTLENLAHGREWIWLSGNHDGDPGLFDMHDEIKLGETALRHIPDLATPSPEIAGHLHPCARIVQRGRSLRRRCFARGGNNLVLPSFGALTGALNVRDEAFGALMMRADSQACLIGRDAVHKVAAARLLAD